MTRTRSYEDRSPSGTWVHKVGSSTSTSTSYQVLERGTIQDEPGRGDGMPLRITKLGCSGGLATGSNRSGSDVTNQYPLYAFQGDTGIGSHSSISGVPSNSALATKALALTNPSRPRVDLPVFAGELLDFPELFKIAGWSIFKRMRKGRKPPGVAEAAASLNLNYQFGWGPLASDLKKFLDFTDHVNKRAEVIRRLRTKGLSRKVDLFSGSTSSSGDFTVHSGWANIWGERSKTTTLKIWGHVKWSPTITTPSTERAIVQKAREAALGLTVDPSTAWELIPFSWMADWCINIGDFLMASRNIIPATPSTPRIMRHTRSEWSTDLYYNVPSGWTVTPCRAYLDTKQRDIASASLTASLPFLSARQLSILGSIGILARKGQVFR